MIKIIWKPESLPNNIQVTQVYGIVFNKNGRILLKVENKNGKQVYSFAGGTPEDFDKTLEDTLNREMLEEVNTTLENELIYLGYQLIEGDGNRLPYAQVRMTGIIKHIGNKLPDPDNGETYERLLVSPYKAIKLLNWGEVGKGQIEEAIKKITQKYNLTIPLDEEEIWL